MKEIKQKFVSAIGTALSSTCNPKEHAESIFSTVKSFLCEICQKSFQTIHSLNSHKKIHFEKTFLCSFCTKKFVSKGQLVVHERSHTKLQPFVCTICDKKFSHRESLITHSSIHTKIKPHKCENCAQTFSCIGNLIKHRKIRPETCGLPKFTNKKKTKRVDVQQVKTRQITISEIKEIKSAPPIDNEASYWEAEVINHEYMEPQEVPIDDYSKIELEVEILQEAEKEPLETFDDDDDVIEEHLDDNLCDEIQTTEVTFELTEDIKLYFDLNKQQYCCKLCPKMYTTKNVATKHLKNEHRIVLDNFIYENTNNRYRKPQKSQNFACKSCPKKFTSAKLAEKHEKCHGDDGLLIYKCSCCPLYFDTQLNVISHQNSEHENRLKCNIEDCSRKFDHPEKLLSHKKYAHLTRAVQKKNVFVCKLCGRSFNTRTAMTDHERSNCGKDPIYECNVCDKKYSSAGILKCHMKIHTQELNFTCIYCSKTFRTKGQQVSHERTHSHDKPFKCQFSDCNASFSHRESLLTHHTTHSGIKRFECEVCNAQFSCISNLMAHKRSRKQDKCGAAFTQIQKVKNAKLTLKQLSSIMEK